MGLRRFQMTLWYGLFGIGVVFLDILFNLDLIERFVLIFQEYERYELDEFVLLGIFFLIGFVLDISRFQRDMLEQRRIERARNEAMLQVMDKVHHVVNNYLNNMLLIKEKLSERQALTDEEQKLFEDAIYEASNALIRLNSPNDFMINPEAESGEDTHPVERFFRLHRKDRGRTQLSKTQDARKSETSQS